MLMKAVLAVKGKRFPVIAFNLEPQGLDTGQSQGVLDEFNCLDTETALPVFRAIAIRFVILVAPFLLDC